jgi:hypothetical protein
MGSEITFLLNLLPSPNLLIKRTQVASLPLGNAGRVYLGLGFQA